MRAYAAEHRVEELTSEVATLVSERQAADARAAEAEWRLAHEVEGLKSIPATTDESE
jgi:hypothetical protein